MSKKTFIIAEKEEEINKLKNELTKNESSATNKDDEFKKLQVQVTTLETAKSTIEDKYRRVIRGLQTKTKEFNSAKEALNNEVDQLKNERTADKEKILTLEESIGEKHSIMNYV